MGARTKLRRLQLRNAHLEDIAGTAEAAKNEIYDVLFPGEPLEEREVRWKWILLEIKRLKRETVPKKRLDKLFKALQQETADANSADN